MFSLRPKQLIAVDNVRASFRAGNKRVMLYSPCRTGKTEIAMHIIQSAQAKGRRVGFVCNRIGLVSQASRRFSQAGIEHGIVQGANTCRSYFPVLVCSIDTLAARGMPEFDLLIIDEAHACAGTKAYVDLLRFHRGPAIGLSATPFARGLGALVDDLGPLFEDLVIATTIREAIADGYLVDCEMYSPPAGDMDLSKIKTVAGDYHQGQLGAELARSRKTRIGDIVGHWKALAGGRSTAVFAFDIADSKAIADQFIHAGISAEHIDCYTKDEDRLKVLERVESGETTVICNCAILAEGWDSPRTKVMINARPTKSLVRWIQSSSRILTAFGDNSLALILDHGGTPHGYPTDDLPLYLDDGKPKKSASKDKDESMPKACPQCYFDKPAGMHECPMCGFAPQRQAKVETIDGKLEKRARKHATIDDKSQVFRELKYICQLRGYDRGWTSHKYREYFGVWPKDVDGPPQQAGLEIYRWLKSREIAWAKSKRA